MAFEALQAELDLDSKGFVSGMAAAKSSMSDMDSQARSVKKGVGMMGAGIAALSAGALAGATAAAAKFETQMVELEKVSSKEFASGFRDTIMQMSRELPSTANELANLAAAAKRFGVAEEHVESFVRSTAKMATATDINIEDAGESFAKLATLTGTPIPKIENLGSSINALANTTATSSSEIVDSMLRSAGTLSQLGMKQTDMVGLSAALNAVSESSERAGTRMRRLAQEMLDPAKMGAIGQALGVTATEFKAMAKNDPTGTILAMAKAMNEGGESADILQRNLSTTSRQALAGLGSNLGKVNEALDTSAKAFKENTSLQNEFQSAMGTAEMAVQQMKSSLLAVAIDTGQVFLPYVTQAINAVRGLVDAFGLLNSKTGGVAGVLVGLAGIVGGLTTAFVAFYPAIIAAGPALGLVATAASAVLLPAAALTAAIIALAAAFKTDFAGIRTVTMDVLGVISSELSKTAALIKTLFGPAFGQATSDVKAFAATASAALKPFIQILGGALVQSIIVAGSTIRTLIQRSVELYNSLSPTQKALLGTAAAVAGAAAAILGLLNPITAAIGAVIGLKMAWDRNLFGVRDTTHQVLTVVKAAWAGLTAFFNSTVKPAWQALQAVIQRVLAFIENTVVKPTLGRLQRLWAVHGDAIMAEVNQTWTAIQGYIETATTAIAAVHDWLRVRIMAVWNVIRPFVLAAVDAIQTAMTAFVNVATTLWNRYGDELLAVTRFAWDAIGGIVEGALDLLLTTLRITLNLIQGDWEGAWSTAQQFIQRTFNGITQFVTGWGGRFVQAIRNALDNATQAFTNFGNNLLWGSIIPELFTGILEHTTAFGGNLVRLFENLLGNTLRSVVSWASNILSQFTEMKTAVIGGRGIIPTMFGDMLGAFDTFTSSWSSELTGFYDNTVGKFQDLANTIVGNSIVPDMFGDMLGAQTRFGSQWQAKWTQRLSNILGSIETWASNSLSEFDGFSDSMKRDAKALLADLLNRFSARFDDIKRVMGQKADQAKQMVLNAFDAMKRSALGTIRNLKADAVRLIRSIGSAGASAFKSAWNRAIPSSISIPSASVNIPKELGGGSKTFGGGSVGLPQLATGGLIEETGVYVGHAGERVLDPAETRQYESGGGGETTVDARIQVDTIEALDADEIETILDRHSEKQRREIERLLGTTG